MMDMEPGLRDQIAERAMREELEMDDRRNRPQDGERQKKGCQRPQGDAPSER